jgi:hypothetical protein
MMDAGTVDILYFDGEWSDSDENRDLYAIGADQYVYFGRGPTGTEGSVQWRKGNPFPNVQAGGYFCVRQGLCYFFYSDRFYVFNSTQIFVSSTLPSSGYDYMCVVSDKIILVSSKNGRDGMAISRDGGQTWLPFHIGAGTDDNTVYSLAAYGLDQAGLFVAVTTKTGLFLFDVVKMSLQHIIRTSSRMGRIFFSEIDGFRIFVAQESGLLRGRINTDLANAPRIQWDPPFLNIPDWYYKVPSGRDDVALLPDSGNQFHQQVISLMNKAIGEMYDYQWYSDGATIDEVGKGGNIYAISSEKKTQSRLIIIDDFFFYLSEDGVLSFSYDAGTDWLELPISSSLSS